MNSLQGPMLSAKRPDKRVVAESFGKAATSYDRVAHLQRYVGNNLAEKLAEAADFRASTVMDMGCGTGYFLPLLNRTFAPQDLIALDLSEGMASYARAHQAESRAAVLVGDAESLPLSDETCDLVFSSLAVQWCESFSDMLEESWRVLKPGGVLAFSTLLDGTLSELKQAWANIDGFRHVNEFLAESSIAEMLRDSPFASVDISTEERVLEYDNVMQLARELKGIGAHNVNRGRNQGMTGKGRIKRLQHEYEAVGSRHGKLIATYYVCYGVLRK